MYTLYCEICRISPVVGSVWGRGRVQACRISHSSLTLRSASPFPASAFTTEAISVQVSSCSCLLTKIKVTAEVSQ